MTVWSNQSPEPTPGGAGRSAIAVHGFRFGVAQLFSLGKASGFAEDKSWQAGWLVVGRSLSREVGSTTVFSRSVFAAFYAVGRGGSLSSRYEHFIA